MKRLVDLLLASPLLLLCAPIMALIALTIRFVMGPPVLFMQLRPGLCGRPFTLLKFRTMQDACDAEGELLPDAQRLTPLGKFLRKTSLDELPQILNVLKGDMSLVGPRPLLLEYMSLYTPEQARRHLVKPGITGWAQVNGRNAVDWESRLAMDVWYVDHQSLWLDMKILILTIARVFNTTDVTQPGRATMEKFRGSR